MSLIKIVAFILITCATATSFAQEIKGIGDFTIGMSVEEFLNLPLIKEKNIQGKENRKYSTDERDIWKTTADSQVEKYDRVYSADVVKFEFKAPMGVPNSLGRDSYDVATTFYKGKLAQVYVLGAGTEFEKILTAKYGRPIKEDKMKRVTCQNGYGAKSSHIDGSESTIWGKGKKITATLVFSFYDCGKGGSSYWVEEGAIVKVMDRIDENGRKAFEAEEAKVKAGASKL
ncbi:MAG: hypothetical protein Q8O23_02235 [Gallionella sp.]|nr:hypothetical protein [Gallionella sp.]